MEQPLIKYVIVQSPQKIVFNFPIPLPAETRLAFPETAMTEIMDRYIEGRAALPDDNHILRIGYSKSWLAQANQQLITDLSINTIIGLTIIFSYFCGFTRRKKPNKASVKPTSPISSHPRFCKIWGTLWSFFRRMEQCH
jgi:hypothetical protein